VKTWARSEEATTRFVGHSPKVVHTDEENAARALRIWNDAVPITGTLAATYLGGRGLHDLPDETILRFHPACPFGDTRAACLVALYRNIKSDEPQAIARTAINPAGNKIGRMSLGPCKNAAIKIDHDTDVEEGLVIGEGLETCLAARQIDFRPVWSVGSANGIKTFPLLDGVESLTVLVDNDEPDQRGRRAGDAAATECWHRWTDAGREVRAFTTDKLNTDIADVMKGSRHG
jgi:putative DNA primase/helicase